MPNTPLDDDVLDFLVFAIDSATVSGWALATGSASEDLLESGVAKKLEHRQAACEAARQRQLDTGLPLVVVAENWPGRWRSWRSAIGMGRQWGMWVYPIHFITGTQEKHILRVNPAAWRNEVYTPEVVREAQQHEDGLRKLAVSVAGVEDHNEAEACCIAFWAHQSFEGQAAAEAALKRLKRRKK